MFVKRLLTLFLSFLITIAGWSQINTDRVMAIGRNALYFEDYVLSIQYFNQVIGARPYLYEPYFYRGLAKFYLEDYTGAEQDCTEALERNPFVIGTYEVRGLSRINRGKFKEAAEDYIQALEYAPEQQGLYQNLVICEMSDSNYVDADKHVDEMIGKWPRSAQPYTLKADIKLKEKDTIQAISLLDKALELDPYEGQAWSGRGILSMTQEKYEDAEEQFGKAIHLLPKSSGNYINRALCRYYLNKLGDAMADYDIALDIEPENYIGHYNRALLRAQLGDDNRAIEDFNFVLQRDPEDYMALYNRATLKEQTGDLRGAIADYTTVINQYPDFWTGLLARAECRRKLGDNKGADQDEFRVTKAQIDKRYQGKTAKVVKTRKRSDKDLENYHSMVVEDETEMEQKYNNDYRGKVQNRKVGMDLQPMFVLTYYEKAREVNTGVHYYKAIDDLYRESMFSQKLLITNSEEPLSEIDADRQFQSLDRHSKELDLVRDSLQAGKIFFARALDYYLVQDLENALSDLTLAIHYNPDLFEAYFTRAVVRYKLMDVTRAQPQVETTESQLVNALARQKQEEVNLSPGMSMENNAMMLDLDQCISKAPDFVYAYYNRGNLSMENRDYRSAIQDYSRALELKNDFAEAFYNRGLAHLALDEISQGIQDLSKAGELGLYTAYNIIKRYSDAKD